MNSISDQATRNIVKTPVAQVLYQAVEIGHVDPDVQDLFYINSPVDLSFDGQLYQARELAINYGSVAANTAQSFTIAISDVSNEIPIFIEATLQSQSPVTVTLRLFLSTAGEDQFTVPYVSTLSQVTVKNGIIQLTSSLADLDSRNLHSEFLNIDDYSSTSLGLNY